MSSDFKRGPRVRDPQLLRRFHAEHQYELCWMCSMRPGSHIHHRVFRSQGGDDVEENLVWLCIVCHNEAHGIRVVC